MVFPQDQMLLGLDTLSTAINKGSQCKSTLPCKPWPFVISIFAKWNEGQKKRESKQHNEEQMRTNCTGVGRFKQFSFQYINNESIPLELPSCIKMKQESSALANIIQPLEEKPDGLPIVLQTIYSTQIYFNTQGFLSLYLTRPVLISGQHLGFPMELRHLFLSVVCRKVLDSNSSALVQSFSHLLTICCGFRTYQAS